MKKFLKRLGIAFAIIFMIVFANGCYFVFNGQFKAAEKIKNKQELNLYEISSIYTMHLAICTAGLVYSPEAAIQQILMSFPHKDVVVFHNKKVATKFKNHPSGIISYSNYTLKNIRFAAAFNGAYKNNEYVYGKMQYPNLLKPTYILNIPIYEGLFRYLQNRGILYSYEFRYIID